MAQTSVDFLWKSLLDSGFKELENVEGFYYKALEIHHQEIVNANWEGCEDSDRAEAYYNETFKTK